jgi:ribosome biogenesis GTPase
MQPTSAAYAHRQGTVFKKTIGNYVVHTQDTHQVINCEISPRLHKQLIYPTADPNSLRHVVREVKEVKVIDPVAVGDQVQFIDTGRGAGLITEVLPRKSKLVRRSAVPMPGAHPFEQIIVANVDQVVPVFSAAQPPPKWNLLDRYLASAESLNLPSLICITKLDLAAQDPRLQAELDIYRQIGYRVLLTSVVTGEGIEELREALQGRISVFVGKSGVGKSSLLNAMQPGLGLRVNAVSQVTGKGKHTTSNLEMFPLENGGSVVDTPGMREFGLWEIDESDLALFFPEMRSYVGRCKFGLDCSHDSEPGCAIRKAVAEGKIAPRRYATFQRLRQE